MIKRGILCGGRNARQISSILHSTERFNRMRESSKAIGGHMSRIRKKDTKPELAVRRLLHRMGYRFRLHRRDLPGTPDICFPSRKKAILVHGCFWHQHACALGGKQPKSNPEYWLPKLTRNRERDQLAEHALGAMGWQSLTIWECELGNAVEIAERVVRFLGAAHG